ncbi:MAG: SAM-dependent methyltransferase [Alphaproteobacteria bacterium]|nr:SAM-dependent methyltransferase [Alphaproteobacteria bacterium]
MLRDILIGRIRKEGGIGVAEYMDLALAHPEHGYYRTKDPLGSAGDFTTAPEISQMFGEILGAWTAEVWRLMGKPAPFTLLECGPGRGTLMADLMRAGSAMPGFRAACRIHLLEINPALRAKQEEKLKGYEIQFHENLSRVPRDAPLIVIANEFLDALPVRQFERTPQDWRERVVLYEEAQGFYFGSRPVENLPHLPVCPAGSVFEISPARTEFMQEIGALLKAASGAALLIDYGHGQSAPGDTLQALCRHRFVSVFDHIGEADLTSHVDFQAAGEAASQSGAVVAGLREQGEFLNELGIAKRARRLMVSASPAQKKDIETALRRLRDSREMGSLFKVLGLQYGLPFALPGF